MDKCHGVDGGPGGMPVRVLSLLCALAIEGCGGGGSQTSTHTVSGSISGLNDAGLVLSDATTTVAPAAQSSSFSFPTQRASGTTYAITVQSHPTGMTCTVTNGSGTIGSADVNNVSVACANSQWTWVSGSSASGALSVYGTQGVAAADNYPSARANAAAWVDSTGQMRLFSGFGWFNFTDSMGTTQGTSYLGEFWRYDSSTRQWTWVNGRIIGASPKPQWSVAGPQPQTGAALWSDATGSAWLYGGYSKEQSPPITIETTSGAFWRYDAASNTWILLAADTATVHGAKGVASPDNYPGTRHDAMSWVDGNGNFWMFGGYGCDVSCASGATLGVTNGPLNDLWKYDRSTTQWTWMAGENTAAAGGVYGSRGIADAANTPGARYGALTWTDSSGNLWMFGGMSADNFLNQTSVQYFNDLWKYSPSTGQWTWMAGSETPDASGVYGTQGTASAGSSPGARAYAAGWTDRNGRLWLFGGNAGTSYFGDLWRYDTATGEWIWLKGSDTPNASGGYAMSGEARAENFPGARNGASAWMDAQQNLWLFGGYGYDANGNLGYLNDLWKL